MTEPVIQHVSDTAFLVAYCRALESERPDALFRDPLASLLGGEKGKRAAESLPTFAMTLWSVTLRTVAIDAYIRRAIDNGVRVIVNLGAGLDTRPYRMDLTADVTWIEADFPDVVAYKTRVLDGHEPKCVLERLPVDLSDHAARRALLNDIGARGDRMLVLTEGVIPYLDEANVAALADDLRALPNVCGWIVDYFAQQVHKYREKSGAAAQMRRTPFKFQPADWFGFFERHGWRAGDVSYLRDIGTRLRRPQPFPWHIRLLMTIMRLTASASKREDFRRFVGSVLLVPNATAEAAGNTVSHH